MASDQAVYINGQLRIQPNKGYKIKIIICVLLAVAAFLITVLGPLSYQLRMLIGCIGLVCAGYAVIDFLFKMNLTYIFDPAERVVYQKVPGLYTRRLMSFEEVYLLPETTYGEVQYVMSNRKNKYGRNYALSNHFALTRKGRQQQALFETEVLEVITELLSKR
jgi:hypothetical protein